MHRLRSGFILALAIALSHAAAGETPWALPDFSHRHRIVIEDAPPGAAAAVVLFSHHGLLRPDHADIRVIDASGASVKHELLWAGTGDQVEILFDAAGREKGAALVVYFGNANASAPPPWIAPAGLVLETRTRAPGDAPNWEQFKAMFDKSAPIQGRALRGRIFDGYNPLGDSSNFVSHYRGHFAISKEGTYAFATSSDDASFIQIDGKPVAEHPGSHGAEGQLGEHHGSVQLGAGVHRIDYFHYQGEGGMQTLAAWKAPGEAHFKLMPDSAFVPVARATAFGIERRDGAALIDFTWRAVNQLIVNGRSIIRVNVFVRFAGSGEFEIDFGDGAKEMFKKDREFLTIEHLYLTTGGFPVRIASVANGSLAAAAQTIRVDPVWSQREDFDDKRWASYRAAIMKNISGPINEPQFATLLAFAGGLEDAPLLRAIVDRSWAILDGPTAPGRTELAYALGMHLRKVAKDYAGTARALDWVLKNDPEAPVAPLAKLYRAWTMIHVEGRCQDALLLLESLPEKSLPKPEDAAVRRMYLGDALAGLGRRDEALARYTAGARPSADRKAATARAGQMLTVQMYIKKKEIEGAIDLLNRLEWDTPAERMSDDTALLRAECFVADGDFQLAAVLMQRIMKANPDSPRMPEMLLMQLKAYRGGKRLDLAGEIFARLRKEYPYAAETALAQVLMGK